MTTLATLIALLAGVALLGQAGLDYFQGEKNVGRNLLVGVVVLGVAALLITAEIATGSRTGLVGAVMRFFTALFNSVAVSFETGAGLPTPAP